MNNSDTSQRFLFDTSAIRGQWSLLETSYQTVLAKHDYPLEVQTLLGEIMAAAILLAATLKFEGHLTIQARGNGPVSLLNVECTHEHQLRAIARWDGDTTGMDFRALLGNAVLAITITPRQGERYQGIVPLTGTSVAECLEFYFAQSEQLPTRFAVTYGRSQQPGAAPHWRAGGVMLQHMPKASPFVANGEGTGEGGLLTHADILSGEEGENWNRANLLLDTVEEMELIGPSVQPTDLLVRLFHEEEPRVFDAQPVRFGCSCSADKVRNSLSIYSAKDIAYMTTAEGIVTADCQFCGAHYELDPRTVGFEAEKAPDA